LLRAIARVNRVFNDKPGGLVVDYIGIGDDLRASLAYNTGDGDDAAMPINVATSRLREKHHVVPEFSRGSITVPAHHVADGTRGSVPSGRRHGDR
jgi:type I restriction enzyme R subunit